MKYTLPDNWYDPENTGIYLSHSQLKNFEDCPAKEMARIRGDYKPEDKRAFLIGRYVDTALTQPHLKKEFHTFNRREMYKVPTIKAVKQAAEDLGYDDAPKNKDDVDKFLSNNPNVHIKIGEKMADIEVADGMIKAAQEDPQMRLILSGEGQVRMVGEVAGVPFRLILDVFTPDKDRFVDLKTARDLEDSWCQELRQRVPFYETWNYWRQLALYQKVIFQNTGEWMLPVIAVITKQDPPDRLILSFEDQDRLDAEVKKVEEFIPQVQLWKTGKEEAPMCEKNSCDWCRKHKKTEIREAISYR